MAGVERVPLMNSIVTMDIGLVVILFAFWLYDYGVICFSDNIGVASQDRFFIAKYDFMQHSLPPFCWKSLPHLMVMHLCKTLHPNLTVVDPFRSFQDLPTQR